MLSISENSRVLTGMWTYTAYLRLHVHPLAIPGKDMFRLLNHSKKAKHLTSPFFAC